MNEYKAHDIIKELYYPSTSFPNDEEILNKYASPEEGVGRPIELPDRITNVNGTHIYKLLSSKDINFNNIYLPNSVVPENNWGSFDKSRRWPSGYPIYINDVYELMNVVDYLLCATEDLWSEIHKLQNEGTTISSIWFINNLNQPINEINKINSNQFVNKGSNYSVLLNPRSFYTTLPLNTMVNFGIATQFFDDDHENFPIIRRAIQPNNKRNGIQGYIEEKDTNNYYVHQNENINGQITTIYGYKVGNELKFYPMFDIDNFFKSSKYDINNFSELIDEQNMKLKGNLYFRRTNGINNTTVFEKLHIDFLYKNYDEVGYPYILYYIDDEGKRQIVYIHTTVGQGNRTISEISSQLLNYSEYINNFYDVDSSTIPYGNLNNFGEELEVYSINEGQQYPYLYKQSDTSRIQFFAQTPNSSNFSLMQNTLPIQYFKSSNELFANIKVDGDNTIELRVDKEQDNGLLHCPERYNIPDNSNIDINITGKYINYDTRIDYDDEYVDLLLPSDDEGLYVHTDEEAQQYYYYNGLGEQGKRIFVQFRNENELNSFINSENPNAININNIDNIKCAHVYKKNEEPYKISYTFTTNSLVTQITDYSIVKDEVSKLGNETSLTNNVNSYTLSFNHILPDEIEQIKFDLNLEVEETSKVQFAELKLPISLNKIHHPCIQFVSRDLLTKEINEYDRYLAYTFGDRPGNVITAPYMYTNKILPEGATNAFLHRYYGNQKDNQNIVQGDVISDQSSNFKELYTYILSRKYDNFEMKDHYNNTIRTDILNGIDNSGIYSDSLQYKTDIESTFTDAFTYDNTVSMMRKLNISYHPENTLLNLVGGGLFDNYLGSSSDKKAMAYFDNVTYYGDNGEEQYVNYNNIFTINGLGFNYRLHGGDSYIYVNKEGVHESTVHVNPTDLPFDNQFDLLVNPCSNNEHNLIKFLEVSLSDRDSEEDEHGHQIYDDVISQGVEFNEEENLIKLIQTDVLDICSTSYLAIVQRDFYRLSGKFPVNFDLRTSTNIAPFTITYNVPITYMNIKGTTFYPNQEILPEDEEVYDLTEDTDLQKYSQYIEFWNSLYDNDTKYKPITLTLKLKENLNNNIPFFRESNTAKLKFDIKRIDPTKVSTSQNSIYKPTGANNIHLALNERYYLSDLIKVDKPLEILGSIGSYPILNEETEVYDIYEYFSCGNQSEYPSSIFYNADKGKYDYSISKCANLNKIHFNTSTLSINGTDYNNLEVNYPNVIDFNFLYYFDTGQLSNILAGDFSQLLDTSSNDIKLMLSNGTIYGSKNYTNNTLSTGPQITIKFIQRTKPDKLLNKLIRVYDIENVYDENDPNSGIVTNDGSPYFIYKKMTSGAVEELQLRHYQFYSVNDSVEILEIPNINRLDKIYIYNDELHIMNCLVNYQNPDFASEGINAGNYHQYYDVIRKAFLDPDCKIYEKLN